MNILVLDTSTSILSIALKTDEGYEERLIDGHFSHSEDLLPEIEAILSRACIDISDISLVIVRSIFLPEESVTLIAALSLRLKASLAARAATIIRLLSSGERISVTSASCSTQQKIL